MHKLRVDELPQLYNVLRGDMSLVGPRSCRSESAKQLMELIPGYNKRLSIKPGITGWAQMNYRFSGSLEDERRKLECDLYYIKNRNLKLDVSILFRSLWIFLWPPD